MGWGEGDMIRRKGREVCVCVYEGVSSREKKKREGCWMLAVLPTRTTQFPGDQAVYETDSSLSCLKYSVIQPLRCDLFLSPL